MRKITMITEHPDGHTIMDVFEIPDHLYPDVYERVHGSSLLYAAASKVTRFEGTVIKLRNPDIPGPRKPEPPELRYEAEPQCGHCIAEGPGKKCWVHTKFDEASINPDFL